MTAVFFHISEHFFEMRFPMEGRAPEVTGQVAGQVAGQVEAILRRVVGEMSRKQLMQTAGLKSRENFEQRYLLPALATGLLEMTLPDKPQSRLQKYRLTQAGRQWLELGGAGDQKQ